MSLLIEFKDNEEREATFLYGGYKFNFETYLDHFVKFTVFDYNHVILYSKKIGYDGNVFFQTDDLFKYITWEKFAKFREMFANYYGENLCRISGTDFFIHEDGPSKRLDELGLEIDYDDIQSDKIMIFFYDKDGGYNEFFDTIHTYKSIRVENEDEELREELQYIVDNILVPF
jgi:hypothetical protein